VTVESGPAGVTPPSNEPVPRTASGDNSALPTANAASGADNTLPELKPVGEGAQPVTQAPQTPPAQLNEAASDSQGSSSTSANNSRQNSSSSSMVQGSNDAQSSSKGKKKKKKLWPL